MLLVKLESPSSEEFHTIWVNREKILVVRAADDDYPNCTFVFLSDGDGPVIVKGLPEDVVTAIRNAP